MQLSLGQLDWKLITTLTDTHAPSLHHPWAVLKIAPSTKTTPKGKWSNAENRKKSNLLSTLKFQEDKDFDYSPLYPHNLES